MMIIAAGNHKLQQMTETSDVCGVAQGDQQKKYQ
jgi:hypothetical protein